MRRLGLKYTAVCSLLLWLSNLTHAQTIIKQDGKYGISDEKGNVVMKLMCDTIYNFFPHMKNANKAPVEMYALKQNGKYAFAVMVNWQSQENRTGDENSAWQTTDMSTDSVRWKISSFIYDTLFPLSAFEDDLNNETRNFEYLNTNIIMIFVRKSFIKEDVKNVNR